MPDWLIVVIYSFLTYLANFVIGPYGYKRSIEYKDNPFKNSTPETISFGRFYLKCLLYTIVPFRTLTRENKYYPIRLLGATVNLIYGGFGVILFIVLNIVLFTGEAIVSVIQKILKI